jgi:hypothetical protein
MDYYGFITSLLKFLPMGKLGNPSALGAEEPPFESE